VDFKTQLEHQSMEKLKITIAVLAWKSHRNLKNVLNSYKRNGLFDVCDEILILFQEISDEDLELAQKFKVDYIGFEENIGIGRAFATLAARAKNENIILLEHDWELIEPKEIVFKRLNQGLSLLNEGFHVVRYRHRKRPGYPHYSFSLKGRELEYYDEWHQITSPHLLDSIHWLDPALAFPDKITKYKEHFITTSRYGNWTNNPCMFKKDFYIEVTKEFLGESIDLERKIAYWWPRQHFKVAHGEGLFKHEDLIKYSTFQRLKIIGAKILDKLKK